MIELCKRKRVHALKRRLNVIQVVLHRISCYLRGDVWFLACLILFNSQAVWHAYYKITEQSDYLQDGSHIKKVIKLMVSHAWNIISDAVIIHVLSCCIPFKKLRRLVRFIVILSTLGLFAADVFVLFQYNTLVDYVMITIVLASNWKQALEFVLTFLLNKKLIFLSFTTVISSSILLLITQRLLQSPFIFNSLIFLCLYRPPTQTDMTLFSLYRGYKMIGPAYSKISLLRRLSNQMTATPVILTSNNATIPAFVLILGESTSRHHMSLYDYSLRTNPLLEERKQQGQLIIFNDTISPHCYTQGTLEKMFTFACRGCEKMWYEQGCLIDIVRSAGYNTIWISNQESISAWGNAATVISSRASSRVFLSSKGVRKSVLFDEYILPHLDRMMKSYANRKTFFVIHLVGTHHRYSHRYPTPKFARFKPSDERGTTHAIRLVQSEYDNAILYNDYIIDSIITRFETENAIVLYLSDHGEEVYDNPDRPYLGHAEYLPSQWMVDIPMIFWTSPLFRKTYPDLVNRIRTAQHRPYMTDDLIHTILDILAIRTKDFEPERSVINPVFNSSRVRVYGSRNQRYSPISR